MFFLKPEFAKSSNIVLREGSQLIAVTNNANAQYMNNYFRVTKRIAPTTFTVSAGGQTWAATTDAFYPSTTGSLITSATYAASSEL